MSKYSRIRGAERGSEFYSKLPVLVRPLRKRKIAGRQIKKLQGQNERGRPFHNLKIAAPQKERQ